MDLKSMMDHVKHAMRGFLYYSGAFGIFHRLRNRDTLTTFMFHRVLPADSVELALSEREFSFTIAGFSRCLDFIQAHYNVVSLRELQQARSGGAPLPPRAGLITFDDGWRDTLLHAAPELAKRGLSGVLFISSEVLASTSDRWWQDQLVSAQLNPLARRQLEALLRVQPDVTLGPEPVGDRQLASVLAALPEARRFELLGSVAKPPSMARQMLTVQDLQLAQGGCLEIGAHGHTHAPITMVNHPAEELSRSFELLASCWSVASMSFPHGAYDTELVQLARQTGFDLIFTSDPVLNDGVQVVKASQRPLGRIHVPENQWTCHRGQLSFPRLATFLFFRPIA